MSKSVYLVEDSAALRRQFLLAIEKTGLPGVAGSASRADLAIREIEELRPDILVLDLQLEQGTGWDVIDQAGSACGHVIILTNHGAAPFRAAAEERGITDFFDKSIEFDLFLERLRALVE